MGSNQHNKFNIIKWIVSSIFVIWSIVFIYQTSYVGQNGHRYQILFEDAFISMRYAWNFAHGLGLVWNHGEYVQGYTNLLMVIFMSIGAFLFDKSNAALFVQVSGVLFMLSIAQMTYKIMEAITEDEEKNTQSFLMIIAYIGALCYYPLTYWSLMGMETGMMTLFVLAGIYNSIVYIQKKQLSKLLLVSIFFALSFLTRNDSIIYALISFSYIIFEKIISRRIDKKFLYPFGFSIGLLTITIIGLFAWQKYYYGEYLSNTYTLKLTGLPLTSRVRDGIGYISPFFIQTSIILLFAILEVIHNYRHEKIFILGCICSPVLYQIYVGGDPFALLWRIICPVMPLILILFVLSIYALVNAISLTSFFHNYFFRKPLIPIQYTSNYILLLLFSFALFVINQDHWKEYSFIIPPTSVKDQRGMINQAIVLNELTKPSATIGVFSAGTLPYYIDRKAIDFLGKSDKYIARLSPDNSGKVSWAGMNSVPGHNKYDLDYSIKQLQPTFVQNFKWGKQDISDWAEIYYKKIIFKDVVLYLRNNSADVQWNKIKK